SVEQTGYVPLREFFTSRGGKVGWDGSKKQVIVSWRETHGEWSAAGLIAESTRIQQELNTSKLKGNATIKIAITGPEESEIPEIPEMTMYLEGAFQQEPLAMHMKQTINLPLEEMELTEEEKASLGLDGISTEMVWTDNSIYQKMPLTDQWIVQDLSGMDIMESLTNMLQITPQQSLEMMGKFGIIYVFGDDVTIDGQEYYTVKNYLDTATYKKIMEEFMGEFNLDSLLAGTQVLPEQDEEATVAEMQKMLEQIMASMELNCYSESLINKETLLTEGGVINLDLKMTLDETISPEGPISFEMQMTGDFQMYDFGEEIQLPDVSGALTQEEFLEQMMKAMEIPVEDE
ncbi:MAG TPA: hypothetical protein GX711_03955, partial [Clostridia bacterium]|nr:hypothetical protein [Clostridia bacterium]